MEKLGGGQGVSLPIAGVIALNCILNVLVGRHRWVFPQRAPDLYVLVRLIEVPTLQCQSLSR